MSKPKVRWVTAKEMKGYECELGWEGDHTGTYGMATLGQITLSQLKEYVGKQGKGRDATNL